MHNLQKRPSLRKGVEKVELFDVYEGEQTGEGYKSLAYKLVFRAKDKTLEDTEINTVMDNILKKLSEIEVQLRS